MADDPENIILVTLRRLDAKLDRVIEDITELKTQQTDAARSIAGLRRDQGADAEATAHIQAPATRGRTLDCRAFGSQ